MIEHRSALNTVQDVNDRFQVGPTDRVLALSALGFDLSVYDIFGVLGAGGAIVIPSPRSLNDPAYLTGLLADHHVTIWNSVPMFVQLFLEGSDPSVGLAGLRIVMMSGDWIPTTLPPRLRAASPDLEIVSLGGATEASIWSIAYSIAEQDPTWTSVPYGFPMRNQQFHILDEHMNDCFDGIAGELYIAGAGLARGYWRDEQNTAARFIAHPTTGERLYRTGDHGRYRTDGIIEFLGRIDGQVKVGGYRIELGEIESALSHHPAIQSSAVVAIGAREDHKSLTAFFVSAIESPPDATALRSYLSSLLPGYMIPSVFHRLAALPLNANEKVDRKALAAWQAPDESALEEIRLPPRDSRTYQDTAEIERQILKIWRDVLNNPLLPADGKLFEHGAHSFHAVDANARINRALDLGCTVTDIFEFSTVRSLAAALAERQVPIAAAMSPAEPDASLNGHAVPPPNMRARRRRHFRTIQPT